MKSTEWKQRFERCFQPELLRKSKLRILSRAWVDDGNGSLEEEATTEQLTPQQFADRVQLMLENQHPSLLEEETSAELIRVLSLPPKGLDTPDGAEAKLHSS